VGVGTIDAIVFLDRDGVINRAVVRDGKPYPPDRLEDLEILPEAYTALPMLKQLGFRLIVVTNQPDVARGKQTREAVEAMHGYLRAQLPIDDFFVCYHDDTDGCDCRKPGPGLLVQAARAHGLPLSKSFLIGDRWRDVDAAHAAGVHAVLIDYGYRERGPAREPAARVRSLAEAADWIRRAASKGCPVPDVNDLQVKLFADGAEKAAMLELYRDPKIQGFTTNPTLMRKAGIKDYEAFSRDILSSIKDRPISLEVFADEFDEMERQANKITTWGDNVYVKIPVTNTRREPALDLICKLSKAGVKLNVTALMTLDQVRDVAAALGGRAPSYVSVFAGRIADTGRDPVPIMAAAVEMVSIYRGMELIWASPRELLNVFQANAIGCHIITATSDILKKLSLVNKDLHEYSLDTVKMFHQDAAASGFEV
jgi:transaldolase